MLAQFRPDELLRNEMVGIESDTRDDVYPTLPMGIVPSSWLDLRRLGTADLSGSFLDIADMATIAELRPQLLSRALHYELPDFDAAAIRIHEPRGLTREISRFLYEFDRDGEPLDGIVYESRFGSGLQLWAVFERGADGGLGRSRLLSDVDADPLTPDTPGLLEAMNLHGLALL